MAIEGMFRKGLRLGIFILLFAGFFPGTHLYTYDPKPGEYEVKAAFLYNFSKFVDWPDKSATGATMTMCVFGLDPFGHNLDELDGKMVRGKKLTIRRTRSLREVKNCHILFISSSEKENVAQIVRALKGMHVLTIGDTGGFGQRGVMINFFMEQNKTRFEINMDAAKEAGLEISSKLLRLSRIVHSLPPEEE